MSKAEEEAAQPTPEQVALVQKLFLKHSLEVRGYLLVFASDPGDVDDLLHSSFLCVVAKAAHFQPGTSFVAWARAIARIELLRLASDRRRAPQFVSPEVIDLLSSDVPQFADDDEFREAMTGCLDRLAPRARQAVDLRYQQSLMPAEIARRMEVTVASVKVTLCRAKAAIQECVERKLRRSDGSRT
jgi:RNA polymerase sigma-70 factor (ECF subfamily)